MNNLTKFMCAYTVALTAAVKKYPEEYSWAADGVPVARVVEKMGVAIAAGTYNKDGRGFRGACKALGLASTYRAINAFVALPGEPNNY